MKTKLHIVIIVALSLVWLILSADAAASDWFVRPAGGNYGSEDGSSYQDAWDGLLNVVWGPGGVEAGDTLWVCGLHDAGYRDRSINVGASGTADNPIIIRGDFPGNPGTIFSCGMKLTSGWEGPDEFGVYSRPYGGSTGSQAFEDMSLRLTKPGRLPDSDWLPSSFYQAGAGETLYYKPSSGTASGHIFYTQSDVVVRITNQNNIHIMNLNLMNAGHIIKLDNASNIVIEGNYLQWAAYYAIPFWHDSDNVSIVNNTMENAGNGIYIINQNGPNSDNSDSYYIANNTIRNINQDYYYGSRDSHAIGIQGGDNGIIEYNHIHNIGGSGITYYACPNQLMNNNTVRYNYVHDVYDLGYMNVNKSKRNERGIEYGNTNSPHNPDDVTGNLVYGNIIANVGGKGLRTKSQQPTTGFSWNFYNNVVYNVGTCFDFNDWPDGDSGFELKNNIFMNPTGYHISHVYRAPGDDYSSIIIENNIYYPDGSNRFEFRNVDSDDFADWQNDSGLDATSFIADPLFVDPENGNFHLRPNSPAIDAGVDIGLTQDFEGDPLPQGSAPDIGAYEYRSEDEIKPGDTLPDKTELTCYNNVFNPAKGERALIVVELPKQGHVRLNLYNTRGNKIRKPADEQKEPGTHKYYWDGKSGNGDVVGSGLYFVHIQAGDYKKTKKIVVVK